MWRILGSRPFCFVMAYVIVIAAVVSLGSSLNLWGLRLGP